MLLIVLNFKEVSTSLEESKFLQKLSSNRGNSDDNDDDDDEEKYTITLNIVLVDSVSRKRGVFCYFCASWENKLTWFNKDTNITELTDFSRTINSQGYGSVAQIASPQPCKSLNFCLIWNHQLSNCLRVIFLDKNIPALIYAYFFNEK